MMRLRNIVSDRPTFSGSIVLVLMLMKRLTNNKFCFSVCLDYLLSLRYSAVPSLKGQSHEKVSEIMI
jgi:hypothetical protein